MNTEQSITDFQKHVVDNSGEMLKDLKVLGQDDENVAVADVLKQGKMTVELTTDEGNKRYDIYGGFRYLKSTSNPALAKTLRDLEVPEIKANILNNFSAVVDA